MILLNGKTCKLGWIVVQTRNREAKKIARILLPYGLLVPFDDAVLKLMELPKKLWVLNYKESLSGNTTNQSLYNVYQEIAENEGYGFDWSKKSAKEIKNELKNIFPLVDINPGILQFDSDIEGNDFSKQLGYQLWHLLYATEDDVKTKEKDMLLYGSSNTSLKKNLFNKFGFKPASHFK